jgi:hypothetical protein
MSAPLFDPDALVREVRAKAGLSPLATTATLLRNDPKRSNVANVAEAGALDTELRCSNAANVAAGATRFEAVRCPPLWTVGTAHRPYQSDVPKEWSEAIDRLLSRPRPEGAPAERWACACRGVEQFAQGWAAKAISLGWTFDELFAFVEPFANVLQGAAWFVGESTITAVTTDAITLRTEGEAVHRIYRKPRA